jgi:hypothetical protein
LRIVLVLIIFSIISLVPQAFAQITFGAPAQHASLKIVIEENGDIHVIHVIKKNDKNVQLSLIPGTVENIQVKDVNGNAVQYAMSGDDVLITLFPPKTNISVEYDLKDVLVVKDGVWTWDYLYTMSENSEFIFPEKVDLVFANNRPVHLIQAEGLRCHGCQMMLEYIIDEPLMINEVEWEGQKFPVFIRTLDEIGPLSFDQPSRSLSFETTDENSFITLVIPLELLWNPYEVYLDGTKILKHEFSNNSTHVWLNIRPEAAGTIEIIGISAIPEFSLMLPLTLGIMMVVGFSIKNKINLR